MDKKLSHLLMELGFFSALGTVEFNRVSPDDYDFIKRGTRFTYGSNNGVTAIYDEDGRPWIIRNEMAQHVAQELAVARRDYNLRIGAYVPHSNDGGNFVRAILPSL